MSIMSDLSAPFATAFVAAAYDASWGEVVPSQRPELAQFQCNGALDAAQPGKSNAPLLVMLGLTGEVLDW